MRFLLFVSILYSCQLWAQAQNKVDGIKITSGVHVYLKDQASDNHIKLSTNAELAEHFKSNSNKIYQYMDFILDFENQKKELKKIENKISTGNHYKINEHLESLNKKGINQFAMIFSMVEDDTQKRTVTLYDIKNSTSGKYQMLARITLDEDESVSSEIISKLFYLGMVTANQAEGMNKKAREIELSINRIFNTLDINEQLLTDLERKAREIDDYPRAKRKESLVNEDKPSAKDIVIQQ